MTTTNWRLAAAVVSVVLVATLGGCSDDGPAPTNGGGTPSIEDGGEPADPAVTAAKPKASFDATVTPEADGIRISYTFTNDSGGELLLVNGLPEPSGASVRYADQLAYVTGEVTGEGDGQVLLSHRAFAWPDTDRMAWGQAPRVGVTRVAAGQTKRVQLTMPLPLERRQPFGDDLGYGEIALPDPVGSVRFCLGAIAAPYHPALGLQTEDDATTIAHGNKTHESQYLFCTDPERTSGL